MKRTRDEKRTRRTRDAKSISSQMGLIGPPTLSHISRRFPVVLPDPLLITTMKQNDEYPASSCQITLLYFSSAHHSTYDPFFRQGSSLALSDLNDARHGLITQPTSRVSSYSDPTSAYHLLPSSTMSIQASNKIVRVVTT